MSQTIFDSRINRITKRTRVKRSDFATGEGLATPTFSSPLPDEIEARSYSAVIMVGLILGVVVGVLAAGLNNPVLPWGSSASFNAQLVQPVSLAMLAAPFLAMLGCTVQSKYHRLYYFSVSYFPAVLTAAFLGSLPIVTSTYEIYAGLID